VNIISSKTDKKLDCVGLYCPEPVFNTRLAIDEMEIGETIEVSADDPAAESDIQNLVKHLGQEIVCTTKEGNTVKIVIKKVA
jgi:tRNA 2-thiouridine synthesizing protein A